MAALNPSMGAPTLLIDGIGDKVRYLDTSGPSMARRSTRPWERRHLLSTDWGLVSSTLLPPSRRIVSYRDDRSHRMLVLAACVASRGGAPSRGRLRRRPRHAR